MLVVLTGQLCTCFVLQKGQLPNEVNRQKLLVFPNSGIGFGSVSATAANSRPGRDEHKLPESAEMFIKAASNCCSIMCGHCCCMCCIQTCSRINDQCAIILTQFCTALSCLGCYSCCEACCGSDSLWKIWHTVWKHALNLRLVILLCSCPWVGW